MVRGIDVSTHNGTLDWASIGAAGIRFAIIRAGYGRYAVDDQFAANIRGAAARSIPAGVYWFSYAVSEDAARQEAEKCLETIKGYDLTLPVFYDFEYDSVRYAQQQGVTVGREQYNRFARAFLEEIRDVCPDKDTPRDGKTVFTGQTFRDVTYKIPDPTPKKPDKRTDKTVGIRAIYQITERTIDKKGQHLFPADLETDIYYCSIDLPDSRIIELYHEHGTMEQFHSEIKTDMGCELLPSGRFAVNSMILHLVQIGYNMLRLIEQRSLSWWSTVSTRRPVQRRRLATVIKNVICAPAQIKTHAREVLADLGKSNIWAGDIMWLARSLAHERATRL